ncbi:uncharacterized protein LOC126675375 [Mercurialis annua]|uniref:uncharacterized protein LOC126675375 n=1 Tax=Mercurialis annua TaxID=3986 RepID=UPI00215E3A07|nr:uncharacterized protein LOC126675375 [Mercurialis annua]
MGNCQAVDTATLVIQYPSGKVDKLFWPVNASEIMKMNPGHYIALLLSTTLYPNSNAQCPNKTTTTTAATAAKNDSLRITRIKLLRPTDTLVLGHVYRLITNEDVMKGLLAKKQAKQKKKGVSESSSEKADVSSGVDFEVKRSLLDKNYQVSNKTERNRGRTATGTNSGSGTVTGRSRTWQPSLNSILESATK